jgi:crotonobetainyl-CoA:carnitine CoA-transferase CaiB-like acyl-CoA transferase
MLSMILGPLAERLIPILQTPVEDIIYEVLDQKGLPTRAEVRDLRNKLDRLEKTLNELTSTLESLKAAVDEASEAAAEARKAPAAAQAVKEASKPAAKPAAKAASKAPATASGKACRVDECGKPVRAKGFCGAHYQKFKRGTLGGWVGADGATTHEEVKYQVGTEYVGQPVETSYEGDDVLFFLPESGGKRLTLKVNDVRID